MIFNLLAPMFVMIALFFLALFLVFKSCARCSYRVTRRDPEDDQPWQYTLSVLAAWLSLLGTVGFALLAGVSWAN